MKDMKNNEAFLKFCEENHLNPDGVQWQAVFEDNNVVVAAGAGSGKTTVLSFRFLRIVAEQKATPDQILTITFTKKATAEMKSRIYQLLSSGLERGLITKNDMDLFPKVTISTVDSFCSEIVRSDSVHQGVPIDFSIQSDDELGNMSDSIAREVLSSINDSEFKNKLYSFFSVENLLQVFHDLASKYLNITKPINKERCLAKLNKMIKEAIKKTIAYYSMLVQTYLDYYAKDDADSERRRLMGIAHEYFVSEDPNKCLEVAQLLENKCFSSTKDAGPEAKPILDELKKFKNKKCQERKDLVVYANAIADIGFMDKFYDLVSLFEQRLFDSKRSQGVLGFQDVMQLAIKILSKNRAIRDEYKSKFRFVMIDEFQDNNDDYRKLLYLLSEKDYAEVDERICDEDGIPTLDALCKDKIFLVGDEKQSIYRFRGADVRVFKRLSSEICPKPLELKRNWRSEPKIIEFCNNVFPRIMQEPGEGIDYEADYIPLECRPQSIDDCHITFIHPNLETDEAKEHDKHECEANVVARFIEKICSPSSDYLVPDDVTKELRPPRYDEIGLLLRFGSHQGDFEKALRSRGIPYSVTEAKSLFLEALANDFYSALQCCVYPYDRIALAAYLKSPFCGLKDSEILDLLKSETLTEAIESNERAKLACSKLNMLSEIVAQQSLANAMEYMWFDMGYRPFMISKPDNQPYSEHYDYMHALAASYDAKGQSLVQLLDYIRPMLGDGKQKVEELTVFNEQVGGVQIMTIHKSKGLAFKVVIVADMTAGGGSGGFQSSITTDDDCIFLPFASDEDGSARNPDIVSNKDLESRLENAETKRIYYVAATRAKHHLVFSGILEEKTKKIAEEDKENKLMTYFLQSIGYSDNGVDSDVPIEDIELSVDFTSKERPQLSAIDFARSMNRWSVPVFEEGPASIAATEIAIQSGDGHVEGERRLKGLSCDSVIEEFGLSKEFGTLVHKMLEIKFTNEIVDFMEMLPESIDEQKKSSLISCAEKLRNGFFESTLYQMVANGFDLYPEKKIVLYLNDQIVNGTIDLLAISNNQAIIIDYKTDATMQEHEAQLGLYKQAISSMYPNCKVKAFVSYLREPESFLEV